MNASGCIIFYKNLVLLARRTEGKDIPFGGYWSIFAGSREPPSEPPMICAIRELEEETGIKLNTKQIKFAKTLRTQNNRLLDLYFHKSDAILDVNLNFEHTEFGWFDVEKLESFPYLIDPKIVKTIKSVC